MHQKSTDSATEIKRLQRCMNDLVSVLALPAVWSGSEPNRILDTFLDALMGILDLAFLYARARFGPHESPIEALRTAQLFGASTIQGELRHALNQWSGENPQQWPDYALDHLGGKKVSFFPIRLGVDGGLGLIVAGSQRLGFPEQTESLVLGVAANQLAIGLQHTVRLNEQKQIASELDRRVAERTRELAEANKELQLQVGLLQHLPVSAWTLKPDGTPEFVNRVWLEFSGQTLDYVRSHPEAWMAAVHPEDREAVSTAFWEGVRTGQSFAFESRSLRASDGTYRWHLQQAVALRDAEGKILKFVGTTTDIDDQKRAEQELRARESDLRKILNSIPGLVCTLSPTGRIELANQQLLKYFGKTLDDLNAWAVSDAVHPDDLPHVIESHTRSMTTGTPYDFEVRCRRADGVYRWFQVRNLPICDSDGRISGWSTLMTDVEDRKRAEEALRESEYESRLIVDSIPGLIAVLDTSGEVERVNQPLLDYLGKSLEELRQWAVDDTIYPGDRSAYLQVFERSFAAGDPFEYEAVRVRRFDGVYRWLTMRGLPLRDRQGKIVRWYFLLTEIDDRKRAEDELKRSEARHRVVVETASDAVVSIDERGTIILANPAMKRIFGYSPEELIGKPLTVLMPGAMGKLHEKGFKQYLETGVRHLNWQGTEMTAQRANGEEFPAEVSFGEMVIDQRKVFTGFIRDISEKKRSEQALRDTQAELARMMRVMTIGQLTASIAHEVNQPLSGIVTNASTCLRMLKSDPPNIDGALETAQRTIRDGNRASEVITRLRTLFSRKPIEAEPLDLNDAAREIVTLLSGELQKDNVILKQEFEDRLPTVAGDRVQLQQVILNLLRNACEAMSSIDDRPRQMVLRTELEGDHVRLSVQDSGVGFTPEIAERMFESFYTTKSDGMGVGLSVSRSIIEANRGRLWATANDGPGATFAFSIPCERSGPEDAS
jgi:PAS domain S-box-containing protein